ncbi:hypothetical protein L1887_15832 [Cichorium endivia]|nr:hypothetical protein L1887_15832 [Cichorium endivia]
MKTRSAGVVFGCMFPFSQKFFESTWKSSFDWSIFPGTGAESTTTTTKGTSTATVAAVEEAEDIFESSDIITKRNVGKPNSSHATAISTASGSPESKEFYEDVISVSGIKREGCASADGEVGGSALTASNIWWWYLTL